MNLTINNKIQLCVLSNALILLIISCFIFNFTDKNLLRIGYSYYFVVIAIVIDRWEKYLLLHICIFCIEFIHAIVYEYANPIMYFNIFNTDKKIIVDFTKYELQLYAQSLWFLTSIKNGLMILVAITQIDITLSKIIYNEIAVTIVIYNVLKNKTFLRNNQDNGDVQLIQSNC